MERPFLKHSKKKAGPVFLLFLFLVLAAFLVLQALSKPTFTVLPYIHKDKANSFERLALGWIFKFRSLLSSSPQTFDLNLSIVAVTNDSGLNLPVPPGNSGTYLNTNGFRVWILSQQEAASLQNSFTSAAGTEVLSRPMISTADGAEATVFTGFSAPVGGMLRDVGLSLSILPKVGRKTTLLSVWPCFTELKTSTNGNVEEVQTRPILVTNLAATLHVQVPKNHGLFLLNDTTNVAHHGILITPKPKG